MIHDNLNYILHHDYFKYIFFVHFDSVQILIKVNPSSKEDQAEELRSSDVIWFNRWNHGLAQHFADIYNLEVWNWREWRNPLDNSVRYKFDFRKVNHGII